MEGPTSGGRGMRRLLVLVGVLGWLIWWPATTATGLTYQTAPPVPNEPETVDEELELLADDWRPQSATEAQEPSAECGASAMGSDSPRQNAPSGPATAGGHLASEDWIASESAQRDLRSIHEVEDTHSDALLGLAIDHNAKRVVAVLDPSVSTSQTASVVDAFNAVDSQLPVEVVLGCNSRATLAATESALHDDAVSGRNAGSTAFMIDAASGKVQVMVDESSDAATIEARYGAAVDVEVVPSLSLLSGSRNADSSPHYGDARVGQTSQDCSSNFTYINIYGVRHGLTAAHCVTGDGVSVESGPYNYGTTFGYRRGGGYDYVALYDAAEDYASTIHTTPGAPTTRPVRGKVTTSVGSYACFGGSFSLAQCGAEVYNANGQVCGDGYCVNGQWARRPASQSWICQPGDSGGVVYQRSGSNALAAGLITAGVVDSGGTPQPVYGYYVCFFQTVAHIEAGSGLAVLSVK